MKKNNSLRSNSLFFIYNTVSWFLRISIIPAECWWQGIFFLLLTRLYFIPLNHIYRYYCFMHSFLCTQGLLCTQNSSLRDRAPQVRCQTPHNSMTGEQIKYSWVILSVLYTQKSSCFLCAVRPVKEFAEILEIQVFALIQKTDCLNREAMSLTFSVSFLAKFCIS